MLRKAFSALSCLTVFSLSNGCVIGGTLWTAKVTEHRTFDTNGISKVEVRTHNGAVEYTASEEAEASVTVIKRAGGNTLRSAEEALEALEVFVERGDAGAQELGWRWNRTKQIGWTAEVQFNIKAPARLDLDFETHNGKVSVAGSDGAVQLLTHNGEIESRSSGKLLNCETHNGEIDVEYKGPSVRLTTHNGGIDADLSKCASVTGSVLTHNGGVELVVSEQTSADVSCSTHNGRLDLEAPITATKITRTSATGKLGAGGQPLEVTTHNGSIKFRKGRG